MYSINTQYLSRFNTRVADKHPLNLKIDLVLSSLRIINMLDRSIEYCWFCSADIKTFCWKWFNFKLWNTLFEHESEVSLTLRYSTSKLWSWRNYRSLFIFGSNYLLILSFVLELLQVHLTRDLTRTPNIPQTWLCVVNNIWVLWRISDIIFCSNIPNKLLEIIQNFMDVWWV